MGRRKIEIKAIKDDRNRSVTFLKRKGGLFKKAHELSVLCSVEVAVIIFGTNKKLYEYSSHDIHDSIQKYQYYGGPHEHKGPADYQGKGGDDGSEGEEGDEAGEEQGQNQNQNQNHTQQAQQGPHQMPGQPLYPPHMRPGQGPSASPPMGNGNMPYHPHRQRTPQPPMGMGSRPASRNDVIRRNTPGLPPQHTPPMNTPPMHGPHPQNGYPHMPSQVYHQVNGQQMMYQPQQQQHPHTGGFAPQGFTQFPPHNPQMQQIYAQEQRRGSLPPHFQEPPRPQSHPQVQVQEPPPQQQTMSPPQIQTEHNNEGLQPHQPKPVKHNSIFTPIDNSRSMLAASWGLGASPIDKQETPIKTEPDDRAKSAEAAALPMKVKPEPAVQSRPEPPFQPQRTQSTTSLSGDASKRPRLKVHIPSEPSEDGVSAGSAPASTQKGQGTASTTNSTPSKNKDGPAGSGVILPPPSPSASAILSAGATGPGNPFARPAPPQNSGGPAQSNAAAFANNQGTSVFDTQTPMSALPSRFAGQLLPSPSQFFSDWNFRSGEDSAILPSPLTFQTPVLPNGPGFGSTQPASNESESDDRKRKLEEDKDTGGEKRLKT